MDSIKGINRTKQDELAKYLLDKRYEACNYYQADTFIAGAALEWVIKGLKSRLEQCLNADSGVCDIWYLESHSDCLLLMNLIYEYSGNEIYNPVLDPYYYNDPWD
jgi:hypothetical protein